VPVGTSSVGVELADLLPADAALKLMALRA
jgi:hypothetical protein